MILQMHQKLLLTWLWCLMLSPHHASEDGKTPEAVLASLLGELAQRGLVPHIPVQQKKTFPIDPSSSTPFYFEENRLRARVLILLIQGEVLFLAA